MSANLLVDLGNTCQQGVTIAPANGVGSSPASGVMIGTPVDLANANTFCNLQVTGGVSLSGSFRLAVQTSPSLNSGEFTDPTSGLAQLPTSFLSGGVMVCNSGAGVSGSPFASGLAQSAAFQRPHRYARAIALSGDQYNAPFCAQFVSQLRTTGSGAGFTFSPTSGVVNV
jgi:hypothetical protein